MPQWKQYSGIWTNTQQAQAVAAETWPGLVFSELYMWGSNSNGELGLGDTTTRLIPTQVTGTDWEKIVGAGRNSTFLQ